MKNGHLKKIYYVDNWRASITNCFKDISVFLFALNSWGAELFFSKPWKLKGFFQFEIITNVLVSSPD